ncbi:unnamed protein product [Nippostrongylus brasiliensis]|uniref:Secreted protein n=1 Tax=Nippostrongylus brasiliensis TaxID=27835 RepID=A0A0N4XK73_NIPBR|nr:unnamed protein product [Nippostrongylus brasiliensis]
MKWISMTLSCKSARFYLMVAEEITIRHTIPLPTVRNLCRRNLSRRMVTIPNCLQHRLVHRGKGVERFKKMRHTYRRPPPESIG